MRAELIPPLLGYYTMAGSAAAPVLPWYLTGSIPAANCIAAYQAKGVASYAASLVNLANPGTHNATEPATPPTWGAATGWVFAGINHLITTVIPTTTYSMIVAFSGATGSTTSEMCGSRNATTNTRFRLGNNQSSNKYYAFADEVISIAPAVESGVMALTPTGGYYNSTKDTDTGGTMSGETAQNIWIGGYNGNDVILNSPFVGNIIALSIYDIDIAAYVAGLTTAMAAL